MMRNDEETNKRRKKDQKEEGDRRVDSTARLFSNGQIREKLKEMVKQFRRGEDLSEE